MPLLESSLRTEALALAKAASGRELRLVADPGAEKLGGWAPKVLAHDPATGKRYLVKPLGADSLSLDAEQAAARLRKLAKFPAVEVAPGEALLPDGEIYRGSAKAMIPSAGNLPSNPTLWTRKQANGVLVDDPWLRLTGNHDAHVRQYVESGKKAVNVDWDRSFDPTIADSALTRFRQGHWYAPTAQDLLYKAYVNGQVDLDLDALVKIADRIQALPDAQALAAVAPFAQKAFASGKPYGPYANRGAFEQAFLARKNGLGAEYRALTAQLKQERATGSQHRLRDLLMGAVEAFNASSAYKGLTKLMQRLGKREATN